MHIKSLLSCPALCDDMDCSLRGSSVHGDSPGENTRVDWHALLQGILWIQGSNLYLLCLLNWQVGSLSLIPPLVRKYSKLRNRPSETSDLVYEILYFE